MPVDVRKKRGGYSQETEESVILEYFGDRVGRFLDVGAYDGVTYSNTRALAERGWRGVLVEPDPRSFSRLLENCREFPDLVLANMALGNYWGPRMFRSCAPSMENNRKFPNGHAGALSSLDAEHCQRWSEKAGGLSFDVMRVWAVPVVDFLRAHPPPFDFVNIDAEGHSWSLLRRAGVDAFGVELLCVEKGHDRANIVGHCDGVGYDVVHETSANVLLGRTRT